MDYPDDQLEFMATYDDNCSHSIDEGCFRCCEQCDTDSHICHGCGEPLYHGKSECSSCADEQYEWSRQNAEGTW